jgi:hypothetical protein
MNDFYLTLPSNTVPENRTSNFSVHLPTKLDLQGKWEVALSEIQYPHSWTNINGSTTKDGAYENCIDVTFENNLTVSLFVPRGYYGTIREFLAAIEYAKDYTSKGIQKAAKRMELLKKNLKKKDTVMKKFRKQLEVRHGKDLITGFQLEFDETLQRVRCKLFPGKVRMVKFSERLQYMLGFDSPTITKSKQLATFQPDLRGGFYSLYIYCSLVEPQIVGNVTAPLLRNVHIEGLHGDMVEKLYHTPHYVPVIAKQVDRIEIDIKDDKNQSVPFQFGKAVVKLHFRKKRALL